MRGIVNKFMLTLLIVMSFIFVLSLISLVWQLVDKGLDRLSLDVLISLPGQLGEEGGFVHAILGTAVMVSLGALAAIPPGLLTALYLSEAKASRMRLGIEFATDLLIGAPSIIIGIFVYFVAVVPFRQYSAIAGAMALALVIFPIVVKTSLEILRLFPASVKHAGLALGLKRWQVTLHIVIWGSRRELLPGILNSLARASGETAPLLFTAFGSPFIIRSLTEPTAAMPIQIYQYATSPYPEWNELAWSASLILVSLIFALQLTSRFLTRSKHR